MTAGAAAAFNARGIERLLRPRSIAIVGASPTPGALGASVLANLERMGFGGDIHLVNPKRDSIGGRPCLKTVEDLPAGVDAAVLAIPRAGVMDSIQALVRREAGAAVIFSAGFAEGGAAGMAEQRQLADLAAASGMVIEGPNCLGLVNYIDGIAMTFVETPAKVLGSRPGVGIVSQSGAMACVVGVTLASKSIGISYSISTGNEAASGVEDYVEYLLADPHTRVIALIVEQFRQPRRFLALATRARNAAKPIVLLHPGRSGAARASAATHTGAMAGDYELMRTLVERRGVLVAGSLEEFSDVLELAIRFPPVPTRGPAVLTESGAFKALTLDTCEQLALELPVVDDASAPALRAALPEFVPVSNPIDLTAQALIDPDLYRRTLSALLPDERFGSIMLGIIQTDARTSALKFPPILAAIETLRPHKPVLFCGLDDGAAVPEHYLEQLRALNVPYFPSPDRGYRAMAAWCRAAARDTDVAELVATPLNETLTTGVIPEYRSKRLLSALGIRFPEGRLVNSLQAAQDTAAEWRTPIALKAQSAALPHKSEAGGVVLGLKDDESIDAGWERLHTSVARHRPGLALDGVLIEKMSRPGVELIIGGRNDPEWGPIVLVGFGGVQAEILGDVRLLPTDLTIAGIEREIHLLKGAAVMRGFRGSPELDVGAVAQIVARLGGLLRAEPRIAEVDLNPVIVYPKGQGAIALDALIVVG